MPATLLRQLGECSLSSKDDGRNENGAGGAYIWRSRTADEPWFTEDKQREYTRIFDARPTLTWCDAHLTVDNSLRQSRMNGEPSASSQNRHLIFTHFIQISGCAR